MLLEWLPTGERPVLLASVSDRIGDDLAGAAAKRNPDPGLVRLFRDKGPQLIQFQDVRCWIAGIRRDHGLTQRGELSGFFLIQLRIVVRETPKVRSIPRKLLRS